MDALSLVLGFVGVLLALLAGAAPSASPAAVRSVTLTPVEYASAYNNQCGGAPQPPYPHPPSTVFVGAVVRAQSNCPRYQGLVRFDLDGLDAASIASARLFYESKLNYNVDGTTDRTRATCVGAIGTTALTWTADEKPLAMVIDLREALRPPHANFKAPPIDIAPFLRANLDDVKSNGLVFEGAVENLAVKHCLAALSHIELRLGISGG